MEPQSIFQAKTQAKIVSIKSGPRILEPGSQMVCNAGSEVLVPRWFWEHRWIDSQRSGCVSQGIVEHEMLHALGTWHEQSRPDRWDKKMFSLCLRELKKNCHRDQYVRINWGNIRPGREVNFERKNPSDVVLYGDYDYGSVMHYSRCGFHSNGWETITPIVSYPSWTHSGGLWTDII